MSRSYKKFPCIKDKEHSGSNKFGKNQANRKLRKMEEVPKQFKKAYPQYNISDYNFKLCEVKNELDEKTKREYYKK